jgi:hypothetical protein
MSLKITPEQQKQLDKAGGRFLRRCFLTGVHTGLLAIAMNIVIGMASYTFLEGSVTPVYIGAFLVGIFSMRRIRSLMAQHHDRLIQEIKTIVPDNN